MKKGLIIAGLASASVAGYMLLQQPKPVENNYNPLDYIPADSAIFSAQLEPFPIKSYLLSAPNLGVSEDPASIEELRDANDKRINFFLEITEQYDAALKDADLFVNTFGLADNIRAYFYTIGLLPVLKIEVEKPQAIWDLLDKAEQKSGYSHQQEKIENTQYRSYLLTDDTDTEKIEMIIAHDNGLLTVTFNSSFNTPELLSSALGLSKANNPISSSGILQEITEKHDFNGQSISYLNHQQIVTGLTTDDGNKLATQLTSYIKQSGRENPFAILKTPQCAAELTSIANNWPRTVFGYTDVTISDKQSDLSVSAVVESNNKVILDALQSIRGHIPKYSMDIDNNVFAVALGLDVNQLPAAATAIITDLQTPTFQCVPLQEMQANFASQVQTSVGVLGMVSGMANGLKGFSFALLDYTMTKKSGQASLESADALFAYSADNPMMLFNSLKMFSPELQQVELKADGSAVDLSSSIGLPPSLPLKPKMAIKGNHLVIYSGSKSEQQANDLSNEAITKNGLLNFTFDFSKLLAPLITATELSGETFPEEALFLKDYNTRMKLLLDVNDKGITISSQVKNSSEK
ncbi:MAG: hypothetical protein V7782_07495 [Psychromonas sp.]